MSDLILEIFSEEIPARMQRKAAGDLKDLLLASFKEVGLGFEAVEVAWTPRRLALSVTGLPDKTEDQREERKGPKVGAPEKALAGFMRGAGLASIDQAEQRDTPKGPVYVAVIEKPGQETKALLPGLITAAMAKLSWPKSMRWGRNTHRWVRPLHSILAVFDGQALDGTYEGLAFDDTTRGHRFMAPEPFSATTWADYKAGLAARFVVLDPEERKAKVAAGAEAVASAEGLSLIEDPGLLEEVTNLVEWPVPVLGRFDEAFLQVPAECLILSMKEHQKYFALRQADGSLANAFVTMANIETPDQGTAIRLGNERVLNARLSDARFFWEQDKRHSLESRLPRLGDIVFHAKIGSVLEKSEAVEALSGALAAKVTGCDVSKTQRAAKLAKADLVTDMVGEFPELQGLMGQYYAQNDGEDPAVALAIAEHYSPLGPSDRCPSAPESLALALADKLWILANFWKIDEKPTGSKDPYALRRAALGVIRLILENGLRLNLTDEVAALAPEQAGDLMNFFADRLKVTLKDRGYRYDSIDAAFAREPEGDLTRLVARVAALEAFRGTEQGADLLAAYKRATNILRAEEKKDGKVFAADSLVPSRLSLAEEQALFDALEGLKAPLAEALASESFEAAMQQLAGLRDPLDAFFEKVVVNADEPELRANRLALLARLAQDMDKIADFAVLEG